ncbi:MAG TPA: nuclear transport factor 2 family protein [Candidatus Acidoferrales bacterium]
MSSTQRAVSSETPVQYRDFERIYKDWDEALARNDAPGLLALYAEDGTLESPLVPHLLGTEKGICKGHAELRRLFQTLAQRKPPVRRFHRTPFLTDGKNKMMWEYPRATPEGDQMDFVEVMELKNGLIQNHRVYWGWFGVGVLQRDAYHK